MRTFSSSIKPTTAIKIMLAVGIATVSSQALAMTAPATTTSLGGQVYDLFINQGYDSGIGYVVAGCLVLWGFMGLKTDWKDSAYKGIAGTGVATLPAILTGFGVTVF